MLEAPEKNEGAYHPESCVRASSRGAEFVLGGIGVEKRELEDADLNGSGRRVLYLSHNGLTEPLGRRQVLPYLTGLIARGWAITVISFEKQRTASPDAVNRVREATRAAGIVWRPCRYHNWPPILGTVVDILRGVVLGFRCARKADLVHARSTVPALIAQVIGSLAGVPWIFDLRGLLAQEYVDAGHWRPHDWRTRITAGTELRLVDSADGLVTLTHRVLENGSLGKAVRHDRPQVVIPCTVDLDTFKPSAAWRYEVRNELGWKDEPALVYSGSLGSWYRLDEMMDFFVIARDEVRGLRFLLLTSQSEMVLANARRRGLNSDVCAMETAPEAVPRYLAACDVGICFLGRHASKAASSPTKYGEYLASGLPVVTNGWIGDALAFEKEPAWVLVNDFDEGAYRAASKRVNSLLAVPDAARNSARELAEREFALSQGIDRYDALYRAVLKV